MQLKNREISACQGTNPHIFNKFGNQWYCVFITLMKQQSQAALKRKEDCLPHGHSCEGPSVGIR